MKATFALARILGVVAAATAAVLWVVLVAVNPYSGSGATVGTYIEAVLFVGLAIYAIHSIWRVRPARVGFAALASFIPVGFYFLLTPGMFRLIGVSDLLLLLSAVALHESRPPSAEPSPTLRHSEAVK